MDLSQIRQIGKSHLIPREKGTHDGPRLAGLEAEKGRSSWPQGSMNPTSVFLGSWCQANGPELTRWKEQGLGIPRSELFQL